MAARIHKPTPVPSLAERRQPGLSDTLTGPKHPAYCQSCGQAKGKKLRRWMECDTWDKDTSTVVVLCDDCSGRLIEPHHRLYKPVEQNAPWPGCMGICIKCTHRRGTVCTEARWNGPHYAVVDIEVKPGTWCHLNYGGGRGETRTIWSHPATGCSHRTERTALVTPAEGTE